MRVQPAHFVRRLLRFIWIAVLFVLGAVALAALVLTPISFIAPFRGEAKVNRLSDLPYAPEEIDPKRLEESHAYQPRIFLSTGSVQLWVGNGGGFSFCSGFTK